MKINKAPHIAFNSLSIRIDKKFLSSSAIKKELTDIKKIIKENKFNKKKHVDVILDYDEYNGFSGIISSKKSGIPMNPDYRKKISTNPSVINDFKQWLDDWNNLYSPESLKRLDELQKKIIEALRKKHNKQ